MDTKTRTVATASVPDVRKILRDLGSRVTDEHSTPGAVGYTTITFTR